MKTLNQSERDAEFACLVVADASDRTEFLLRNTLLCMAGITMWAATGQVVMLIWGFGYVALNVAYVRYLTAQVAPIGQAQMICGIAFSAAVAFSLCGMVIYVSFLMDGDLLLLASCGCIGLALHCLSRNNDFTYAAFVDVGATVVAGVGITTSAAVHATNLWVALAVVTGTLGVTVYFLLSFQRIVNERKRLYQRLEMENQSQKMRALGQLTSGIAHDFNNLLTVIGGNIELALTDPDTRETSKYLGSAYHASRRGAELVQQLLAYARQSKLELREVELGAMLIRLTALLERVLPAHISLDIRTPNEQISVEADPAMLDSALLNLVINASDAMGDHPGQIMVSAAADAPAQTVCLIVEDTGPGIDATILPRVTEPFYTTKTVGQGSGLGLSMIKGFADQCGGTLTLENRTEGGLRARLTLPITPVTMAQSKT